MTSSMMQLIGPVKSCALRPATEPSSPLHVSLAVVDDAPSLIAPEAIFPLRWRAELLTVKATGNILSITTKARNHAGLRDLLMMECE